MLSLSPDARRALAAHAEADYPHECCGLLLGAVERGPGGTLWRALRAEPARNLERERAGDRYHLDPADRLRVEEAARAAGLETVGFYHSHPDHDAYFSATDLERSEERQWGEPWLPATYAYLVVAVRAGIAGPMRAFVVVEGRSVEAPVTLA